MATHALIMSSGPVTRAIRVMHREPVRRSPLQRALRWVVLMLVGEAA